MKVKIKISDDRMVELINFIDQKSGSAEELARAQAIFMYNQNTDLNLINILTGFKLSTILKWRSRFIKGGINAILEKKRKSRSLLTRSQRDEIINNITNKTPRIFGYETDHWTTTILAHLIKEQYNVQYKTKRPLYVLFEEAKFSYHKPDKQYHNRSQKEIDEWVTTYKPIIESFRKETETVILTGDEMVLSTQTTFQKIWLPVNEFPKIDVSNKRANRSIYGFLNITNGVQHAYKTERQNGKTTCKVLEELCKNYIDKKIVIIWDNASWHKSLEVRKWLSCQKKYNIHLISFPRYAPELNPQEHVWKSGRSNITHNKFIENIDAATDEFVAYLNNELFKYSFLD